MRMVFGEREGVKMLRDVEGMKRTLSAARSLLFIISTARVFTTPPPSLKLCPKRQAYGNITEMECTWMKDDVR